MSAHYSDGTVTVHHGDCIEVLATLPDASVESVVTDPPYGINFMGREWDRPMLGQMATGREQRGAFAYGGTHSRGYADNDNRQFQAWCERWATECLRVLKPGGYMVAFGGTRTFHRLTAGIEDAGFEVRDVLSWLYGSGFPKSRNIGPETGGAWEGWGTALKPAWEPIVLARKPFAGTVAGNVLAHGTGALNIDACRVPMSDSDRAAIDAKHAGMDIDGYQRVAGVSLNLSVKPMPLKAAQGHELGRFPANVIRDDTAGAAIDQQTGEPVARFFYSAKANGNERPVIDGVAHPTVKPLALMEWLIRLVTPPGGTVLDPFAGSGTTLEAAQYTGHRAIGIEKGDEYLPLIVHRLERADPRVKAPKPLETHPDQQSIYDALEAMT